MNWLLDFFKRRKERQELEVVREKSDMETLMYCTKRLLELRSRWKHFEVRKALRQRILVCSGSVEELLAWTEQTLTTIQNAGYPSESWKRMPFVEAQVIFDDYLVIGNSSADVDVLLDQLLTMQLKIVEYLQSEEPEYKTKRNYYLRSYRNVLIDQLHVTEAFIEHFQ